MPTPPTAYITPDDLKTALGPSTYVAIFDDDNLGGVADDNPGVLLVIERAHVEVLSYVPRAYDSLPTGIPTLLKSCELDYAVALSFERHPEYVRSYGEEARSARWKRAETKMERVADSVQQLTDNAPAPKPGTEGGIIFDPDPRRTIIASADGQRNGGDF